MKRNSDLRAENETLRQKIAALENQLAWNVSARKMATDILLESSGRFHTLFETMVQGVVYQDAEGHITLANPAAEQILGLSLEEMQGRKSVDPRWHAIREDGSAFPGEQHPAMLALKTGAPVHDVVMGVFHPGESAYRWVLVNAMPEFRNDEPTPYRVYTTITDITENKKAEAALQKSEHVLRLFVEHAPAAIAMFDTQMRYIAVSRRYLRDYGLGEQDVTGRSHYEVFPEIPERWEKIHQRCLGGAIENAEADPFPRADGSLDWVRWEIRPWYESEGQVGGLLLFSDVVTEQKQAENALRESEEKYRALINGMNDTVWVLDNNAHIRDVNTTAIRTLGYSKEELLTMQVSDIDSSLTPEQIKELLNQMSTGQQQVFETCHKTKDGREIPVEISSSLVTYMGQVVVMSIARDITERKQAENALRESEARYHHILDTMLEGCQLIDFDWKYVYINAVAASQGHRKPKDLIGRTMMEMYPEIDQTHLFKTLRKCMVERIPTRLENQFTFPDGNHGWFELSIQPVEQGLFILSMDISGRKQAEIALRESEEKYRTLITATSDGVYIAQDGKFIFANPALPASLGYTPEEFEHLPFAQVLAPEYLELWTNRFHLRLAGKNPPPNYQVQFLHKSGEKVWFDIRATVINYHERPAVFGIARNITEQQQVQEKLRQSEERYRYLFENNPHPMWAYDRKTSGFLAVNEAAVNKYGYTRAEFLGMTLADIRPSEDVARLTRDLAQPRPALQHSGEWRHKLKNGSIIDVEISSHTLEIEGIDAALVVALDVTERKQAEAALAESEQRYRALIDQLPIVVYAEDGAGQIQFISPQIESMLGYTPKEWLAGGFNIWKNSIHPDDREQVTLEYLDCVQNCRPFHREYRLIKKDGQMLWVEDQFRILINQQSLPFIVHGVMYDITERKLADEKLQQANERFTQLAANIDDIFWMSDPLTRENIYVSPAFEEVIGLSPESVSQLPGKFLDVLLPEDRPILVQAREQEKSGQPTNIQYRIRRPDGSIRWLRDKGAPVFDDDGRVVRVVGIIHDMTDEVETNARLRESEERFRRIAETIDELFWMADLDFDNILYASQSYERIWGRTLQSLYENPASFTDAIHPNDRERILADFRNRSNKKPFSREFRIIQPDGSERWVWSRVYTVQREPGQPRYFVGVLQDITERKQAEAESLYRQARLELVVQLGKNITAITDLDKCLRAIHHSVSRGLEFDRVGVFLYDARKQGISGVYGTSRAGEMESNDWFDESIRDHSDWQIALQSPAGIAFTEDYQALHSPSPESEMYGVKEHVTLAAWAGDNPVALLTVDNLVSGRPIPPADREALQLFAGYAGLAIENARMNTLLEQRVRERTAEVQDLYDNAPTGYHSLDAEGRFIRINKTELGWLGYTREEMVGRRFSDFLTPESVETFKTSFPLFKQRGWIRDLEFELVRKDGSSLPVLLNATAIYDEAGNFLNSRSTIFDNTERKQAEAALRESEETYRALFENASDAIFLLDISTRTYARLNPRCAALLGVPTAEELIGRHAYEFIKPSDMAEANDHMQALLSGQPQPTYERTFVRVDGSFVETEINLALIRDGQGNPRYVQSVVRDISERKKVEQALRSANLEMERAMHMKDEFLASMSHELRTPLTGILGLSEALQMKTYGDLNERQLKSLKHIETSGRHLLELINDILDLSKIEAGKFEMQFEPCSLDDICQASLQLTKGMAHKKQQRVSFAIEPASLVVRADPRRLKQMLVNLLSNAIKFTPEGGSLGLEVRAEGKAGVVAIAVWDKGMGIAEENLKRLFKPFVQLDSSLARQHSGTGLGLSLVQRMAELHGGSVRVASAPGEGSRFTILLPWSAQATRPVRHADVGTGSLHPSLTVEDSEIDAEHITRYLRHLGIENAVHPVGQDAVEAATRMKPGVILLDLHLPDMSGFEVLAALKADPRTRSIPVVICSVEESRQKALAQGAAGYLMKPFTLNEVRIELARVASEQGFQESVLTIAPRHAIPRILVVDDNEVTLETLSDFLAVQKFQVRSARSGMEALDQAFQTYPDLILMDIQMPGMDGLETIRRIRAHTDSQVARAPIIALTALAMPGDREMCMKAGANEYMAKPVQLKQLAETIRAMLSLP